MVNSKTQASNYKQIQNNQAQNSKQYDLEDRTYGFARRCRDFVSKLPKTIPNIEYGKQLCRSSGSQAANYIEANESLSKRDFGHRIKISRKEAKESRLWLRLCEIRDDGDKVLAVEQEELIQEARELTSIFSAIFEKTK